MLAVHVLHGSVSSGTDFVLLHGPNLITLQASASPCSATVQGVTTTTTMTHDFTSFVLQHLCGLCPGGLLRGVLGGEEWPADIVGEEDWGAGAGRGAVSHTHVQYRVLLCLISLRLSYCFVDWSSREKLDDNLVNAMDSEQTADQSPDSRPALMFKIASKRESWRVTWHNNSILTGTSESPDFGLWMTLVS